MRLNLTCLVCTTVKTSDHIRVSQALGLWYCCRDHFPKVETKEVTSRILAALSTSEGLTLDSKSRLLISRVEAE